MTDTPRADAKSRAAYASEIALAVLAKVVPLMEEFPPPDNEVDSGVSGWVHALSLVQLTLVRKFDVPDTELAKALRLLADNIDCHPAAPLTRGSGSKAPLEWKVDF